MSNFHQINVVENSEKINSRAKRRRDGYFAERKQSHYNLRCPIDRYYREKNKDAKIKKMIEEEY